ncbi:hypothetical protein AM500_04775 [Bacillus sp. FJAT-18017]|uniref:PxKF domain-containing protein n=1 Tax=Bacillus sp. FJAT-18017 TaxID=1705566 RepID=UPI0006ADE8DD|nr:PxKF domain-containing protein [Bacillus sp. FJAT-18017]ALC89179.1 hypothetical protein AM500_04775 [Bacillus sp. FJAT-18017]
MQRKSSFKKKAAASLTALMISGLIPAGAAWAQGELVAEMVAEQGVTISGRPGENIMVPVNIYVTPKGTGETSAVTVTANFDGKPSKSITFKANEFNVKKQVLLEYTIPQTTATTVSPMVKMTSTDTTGNDQVSNGTADYVLINVIPNDTTAPTLTFLDQISGIFNVSTLPSQFKFSQDEAGEVFVNGESKGTFPAGVHQFNLPASLQGNNNVTVTAKDAAGNFSTPVSFNYFYDSIAPEVTATADRAPNSNDWYNGDVEVTFDATDVNGSGVRSIDDSVTISTEGKNQVITGKATDIAGNEGTGSITLNIDKTAPTIGGSPDRVANENGWYKEDVTVNFSAEDNLSGLEGDIPSVPLTTEGENQSASGTAFDKAGNKVSTTVSGINIDKTNPVIAGFKDGGNYTFTLNQAVTWSATDALSGLATDATGTIDTSKVGPQTETITVTDKAGNTESVTINYSVEYNYSGVLQPINKDGSSIFKAGSTVPVKFQLKDSKGAFVSNATASISLTKYSDKVLGDNVEVISTSAATTGNLFRYDSSSNQYIFNLSTKGLTAGAYQITIVLDDGTTQTIKISLK